MVAIGLVVVIPMGVPSVPAIDVMAPISVSIADPTSAISIVGRAVIFGLAPTLVPVAVARHTNAVITIAVAALVGASLRSADRHCRKSQGDCAGSHQKSHFGQH